MIEKILFQAALQTLDSAITPLVLIPIQKNKTINIWAICTIRLDTGDSKTQVITGGAKDINGVRSIIQAALSFPLIMSRNDSTVCGLTSEIKGSNLVINAQGQIAVVDWFIEGYYITMP